MSASERMREWALSVCRRTNPRAFNRPVIMTDEELNTHLAEEEAKRQEWLMRREIGFHRAPTLK